ncbi:hypothetical protein ACOSQ4_032404 [Xanthoceras sorbifolium]
MEMDKMFVFSTHLKEVNMEEETRAPNSKASSSKRMISWVDIEDRTKSSTNQQEEKARQEPTKIPQPHKEVNSNPYGSC